MKAAPNREEVGDRAAMPTLVMGYIEVVAPDDEAGIPYDEAVIHLEGDEDSEISIRCPDALRLAQLIVTACNAHDGLVKALEEILSAEKEFREGMPPGWEGDPLTDACASARTALSQLTPQSSETEVRP